MLRKLLFLFLFFCYFTKAFPRPQDFFYATSPEPLDTLTRRIPSDTLPELPVRRFLPTDQFSEEVLRHFSLSDDITSEDIDNSLAESFGDLLHMRSHLDIVRIGSWGQPENVYLDGNGRGINIFIDGNLIQQQDLYFPQKGVLDLNSTPLSFISKVEFLPAGLASLWGKDAGVMGLNIISKDFDGTEPYSRVTADRGPDGFHRTQVELGRGLATRGRFYLTGEFKKSDGYMLNADYDAFALSGKTTFNLSRDMDLKLFAYQYKTKMGVPLFPEASSQDVRKKLNNWATIASLLLQEKTNSVLNLNLRYDKQDQEVKSGSYSFATKKTEETFALTATQTLLFKERHHIKAEGYGERKSFEVLKTKHVIHGGYVSIADAVRVDPKWELLLFSKIEKDEKLGAEFSLSGGASYQIARDINLFLTWGSFTSFPTLMDRLWLPFSVNLRDAGTDYIEEGNNNLKAQKSLLVDFGASIQKRSYDLGAYIFYSKINDFIFWSNVDTSVYFGHFKPVNTKAKMGGVNLSGNLRFLNYVRTYVSYCFKKGEDLNRKTKLPYLPEHSLFGYIEFENEYLKREIGLKLRLETNVLSERFMDEYENDKEPGVATLNGKITVRFLDFHFYYMVRNITDQLYRLSTDYFMPERAFWWGFYWEFFD